MALFFKFVDVTLFIFYFLTTLADKLSFKTESKGHPKTTFYRWIGFLPAPTKQSSTHGLDFMYQIATQILKLINTVNIHNLGLLPRSCRGRDVKPFYRVF